MGVLVMVDPRCEGYERATNMSDDSCCFENWLSAILAMFIVVLIVRESLAATPSAIRIMMRIGAID
jgi:hypothetical protein